MNDGLSTVSGPGLEIIAEIKFVGTEFNAITTFSGAPNMYSSTGEITAEVTTTVFGETETEINEDTDYIGSGDWALSGMTLTLFPDDVTESTDFEITELSGSTLKFKKTINETLEEDGFIKKSSGTIYFAFKKK